MNNNICFQTSNICERRSIDIVNIHRYLRENGYNVTSDIDGCDYIIFYGCAFNQTKEDESRSKVEYLLKTKKETPVIIMEGIADIRGDYFIKQFNVNPDNIIKHQECQKLDHFFNKKIPWDRFMYSDGLLSIRKGGIWRVQVCHGCNSNCSYCGDKKIVKNIVSKPFTQIANEIKEGLENGYTKIELLGDDVGAYGLDIDSTLISILEYLAQLEADLKADISVSMQEINIKYLIKYKEELKELLPRLKLDNIVIGFQSGNDRILKLMKRGYNREDIFPLLILFQENNVRMRFHAIIGFPTETFQEASETMGFIGANIFDSGTIFIYQDRNYSPATDILPKQTKQEIEIKINSAIQTLPNYGYKTEKQADKIRVWR